MADHARSDDPAVQAQLDRFAQLSPGRDILGLERITALMAALGNPHLRMPPAFHVAGTNGKGSTCTFLRFMLEEAGYRVHVYTSPHLVRFNERIRVAGQLISDATLSHVLREVLDAAEAAGLSPSFFEATTAAAFLTFSRTPADACIIEVGLGGRLDATNINYPVLASGIAQLGIDHQAFLGDDAVTIAGEKAGIAKAGVPLLTLPYPPDIAAKVAEVAAQAGTQVTVITPHAQNLGLAGAFQADNAALAVAMIKRQNKLALSSESITAGLTKAHWPARLQRLKQGPLVPENCEIWLDGCHNPAGAKLIAAHFNDGRPLHLICGILANKDATGILAPFKGIAQSLTAVPIVDHPHHSTLALVQTAHGLGMVATIAPHVSQAITVTAAPRTLIMGSLYLASEVLRLNGEWPE